MHLWFLDLISPSYLRCSLPARQSLRCALHLPSMVSVSIWTGELLCDSSTGSLPPLVPLQIRHQIFNLLHDVAHSGVCASRRLISSKFVWPDLSRDLGLWTRFYLSGQRSKVSAHVHSSVPAIPVPTRRFSHVHIDIMGPLPSNQGYFYLLTMIKWMSCWLVVAPLASISAETCVKAFLSTWVSRFGVPAVLTSDKGAQFTSSVWSGVCSSLEILASTTTSFHPQSNGMIQRFCLAGSDWFLHLPLVLLGLRTASKDGTGLSVSKDVYGFPLTIPGEFLGSPELPPSAYLSRTEQAVAGFAIPPPHHVP